MKKGFIIAFLLLIFSQYAIAQITTADIREQIANGECETAQSLYKVYKAKNGANKTIEREIADCITGSSSSHGGTGTADGHEYVDLGLPSGTLWATCNVGADAPERCGDYFAWGETQTKDTYNWDNYKYANGSSDRLTKYCNKSSYGNYGFTDNLTTLQVGDDPATANWGSGWRTPTKVQWDELHKNTTYKWTTQNGVKGCLFTAKNRHTLFLPAALYQSNIFLHNGQIYYGGHGSYGFYWSSSLNTVTPSSAWGFYFDSDGYDVRSDDRDGPDHPGSSVRAVRSASQN